MNTPFLAARRQLEQARKNLVRIGIEPDVQYEGCDNPLDALDVAIHNLECWHEANVMVDARLLAKARSLLTDKMALHLWLCHGPMDAACDIDRCDRPAERERWHAYQHAKGVRP